MSTRRADLLALTPDALAELTNRGLVKRAAKTVDEGAGPAVSVLGDGSVHGVAPDGAETTVPVGGLDGARCSCGAAGVCRHVLAVVLAYQGLEDAAAPDVSEGADPPPAVEDWSPGSFSDHDLTALLGARTLTSARRRLREGFLARVHRADASDPVPYVELPACTVRFLVPHDLAYARSDAGAGTGVEIALAVWAWRTYEEAGTLEGHFLVGGGEGAAGAHRADTASAAAAELARDVLLTGVAHLGSGFGPALARVRRDLAEAGLRWPLLAAEDLAEQIDAYAARSAVHRPARVADLLAELAARAKAASSAAGSPRARILGTEEAAETQLRVVRLAGLGCRVEAYGDERRVRVFFAEANNGTVLTLHHRWAPESGPADGPALASRRLAGTTLRELAGGSVVTESAWRGADRRLRLAAGRVGKTTVGLSSGDWGGLPRQLVLRDLAAASAEFERLPPRLIRPRIEAEDVRVIEVGAVETVAYRPGEQRLEARIAGAGGGNATLVADYRGVAPGALDALARALDAEPRFLSGTVRRGRGGLEVAPLAVVTAAGVVVPDLVAGTGPLPAEDTESEPADATAAALESAHGLLAEMAHRGARHLVASFGDRLAGTAAALDGAGLGRCAGDLRELARELGADPGAGTFRAWSAAMVRIVTAAEAR